MPESREIFLKENPFAETIDASGLRDWIYRAIRVRAANGLLRPGARSLLGQLPLRGRDGRHRGGNCLWQRVQFAVAGNPVRSNGLVGPHLSLFTGGDF